MPIASDPTVKNSIILILYSSLYSYGLLTWQLIVKFIIVLVLVLPGESWAQW